MPYILIIVAFVILLYLISRLMKQSNSPRLNRIFRYGFAVIMGLLGFLILIRGNVAVAGILGLLAFLSAQGSLWTVMGGAPLTPRKTGRRHDARSRKSLPMTREEALDILGLEGNPGPSEIKEAHHKLLKKIHPDQGGSDYLAMKINQARDILMG